MEFVTKFISANLSCCVNRNEMDFGMFSDGRFLAKHYRSRGVAVELATPRQAKNVSHSYLIGGVGVTLN